MSASPSLFSDQLDAETIERIQGLPGPILVTGATGFIGAQLFFSLATRRADVFAGVRNQDSSWRLQHFPNVKALLLPMDITDRRSMRDVFEKLRPKTIFHLATYGAYERQSQAEQIHRVNYLGTEALLSLAFEFGVQAFVQTGSSSEYGLNCKAPRETDPLVPNSDYAVSKIGAAYLAQFYGKVRGMPVNHLRLYSVYGPWEDQDRLIPRLVNQGLQGRYPALTNPTISRDFIYIDDCVRALILSAAKGTSQFPGAIYNIGTGTQTTLGTLAEVAQRVFNIPQAPSFGTFPSRKWDMSEWYSNPQLAEKELGFKSQVRLEDGLQRTAQWVQAAQDILTFIPRPNARHKISAVVACYRDHQAIPIMHERLVQTFKKIGVDYEIIFVNDGSPANDGAVIEEICQKDPQVIGVHHSRNFGSQSAFLSGAEISTGDAVCFLDGDLQDPPELIEEFYKKWSEEGFQVVYGVRVKRDAPLHMQFLYKAFYRIFSHLSDIQIPRDAGDFSLSDRRVINEILSLPERDFFLRGLRAWVGFRQTGVEYVRPERLFGRTTNNFWKNIWWAKKGIFSFSTKPLEYMQRLSVMMLLLSSAAAIFYFVNYFVNPEERAPGITTIILLVLILGSIQLLSLSVVGDYVSKTLEESKARPRFIRAKITRGAASFASVADFLGGKKA